MSNNPFEAPQQMSHGHPGGLPSHGRGYVSQVPVIAALMIAQGVLFLLMAGYMAVTAVFITQMDDFMPPHAQRGPEIQEMMDSQMWMMGIGFGIVAGVVSVLSIMHFVAAYLGFKYQKRVFGIVTMIMGLGSMITCYCAPTAIGLAVYGMIIYFNPAVAQAFTLGNSGMKKQEIMERFPN